MRRGPQAVAIAAAFSAIAGLFLAIRLFCRLRIIRQTGVDDILAAVAVGLSLTLTALIAAQEQHGLGQHFHTLKEGEYMQMLKPFWISVPIYNLGLTTIKCSVILQFLRFMVDNRIRKICWGLLIIVSCYGLANFLGSILPCIPVAKFWDRAIEGQCMNLLAFWYCNAGFNIITDIIVVAIPISVFRSLQLPRRQKYGLLIVFALGGFGCITSILRLHSIYVIAKSDDVTWDNVGAATWSAVELNTAIICACLPTLKPVINIVFPRLLGSRARTYSRSLPHYPNQQPVDRHQSLAPLSPEPKDKDTPWHGGYTVTITSGGDS